MNLGGAIRINKTGFIILVLAIVFLVYYYCNNGESQLTKNTENGQTNLRTLLLFAIKAAKIGGIEVVAVKNNLVIKNKGLTKEGANDSYTTADVNSHCSMVALLKKGFPHINLISEEQRTKCDKDFHLDTINVNDISTLQDKYVSEKDITVWIDPLDATQEYTEKLYDYVTTMVCVAVKGKPMLGVVHNPFKDETFWAWVGQGTSDNLKPKDAKSTQTKIVISRSHAGKMQEIIKENFANENIEVIKAGGAGYKAIQVATGQADYYLHVTEIKKWDICAGNAILNALKGKLSTKYDREIDYSDSVNVVNKDGVIASLRNHNKFVGKI